MARMTTVLAVAWLAIALLACNDSGSESDPGGGNDATIDPGTDGVVADPAGNDAPDALDVPLDLGEVAPGDLATPDVPDDVNPSDTVPADVPSTDMTVDIPVQTCCMYDHDCPAGWACISIPNHMGACKPLLGKDMCWSGHDCGPGRTCLGAIPCRCDQVEEGDGCDIPGTCIDDVGGCCDSDWECPAHQVCVPGGTCRDEAPAGRCWSDADCYGAGQKCTGGFACPCEYDCGVMAAPGTCTPVPTGCCSSDDDCAEDTECRFADPASHLPGRCVASHLGAACLGDQACCWEDGDCPGGYCQGAYGCGCSELCPMCGQCAPEQMGYCASWAIEVKLTSSAGQCQADSDYPAFSYWKVPLGWHTSLPAKTQIEMARNAFTGSEGYMPLTEGFVQDHSWDYSLGTMAFMAPAKAGDEVLIRVRATGQNGEKGLSEVLHLPIDAAMAACMFPFDVACSDGTPIMCRALPPACDLDKVMAAYQGCQHCVYAKTCTCDDGSPATCAVAETPTCEPGDVLAVQGGCYACVSPMTCHTASAW